MSLVVSLEYNRFGLTSPVFTLMTVVHGSTQTAPRGTSREQETTGLTLSRCLGNQSQKIAMFQE